MAPTDVDPIAADRARTALETGSRVQGQTSRVARDLALVVLAALLAFMWWRGPLIYYVGEHGPGLVQPGVVPDDMALTFAERWATIRYTFVAKTFKAQVATLLPWVHPSIRAAFQRDADEEEREVKKWDVSSQVTQVQSTVARREGNIFRIVVTGVRTVWIGSSQRDEAMRVEVTLLPWRQPKSWGQLIVTRSHFTPLFSAAGS